MLLIKLREPFGLCSLVKVEVWMNGWRKPAGLGLPISPLLSSVRCPWETEKAHAISWSHRHWSQDPPWPTDFWLFWGLLAKQESSSSFALDNLASLCFLVYSPFLPISFTLYSLLTTHTHICWSFCLGEEWTGHG